MFNEKMTYLICGVDARISFQETINHLCIATFGRHNQWRPTTLENWNVTEIITWNPGSQHGSPQRQNIRICKGFYREFDKIVKMYENRHWSVHDLMKWCLCIVSCPIKSILTSFSVLICVKHHFIRYIYGGFNTTIHFPFLDACN